MKTEERWELDGLPEVTPPENTWKKQGLKLGFTTHAKGCIIDTDTDSVIIDRLTKRC